MSYPFFTLTDFIAKYSLNLEEDNRTWSRAVKITNLYATDCFSLRFEQSADTFEEAKNKLCEKISNRYLYLRDANGQPIQIGPFIIYNDKKRLYKQIGGIFLDENSRLIVVLD